MCGVLQSVSTITKSDVTHKYISQNHDYKQLHILESEKHGQWLWYQRKFQPFYRRNIKKFEDCGKTRTVRTQPAKLYPTSKAHYWQCREKKIRKVQF